MVNSEKKCAGKKCVLEEMSFGKEIQKLFLEYVAVRYMYQSGDSLENGSS
jgi:hypothetical protein